MSPGLSVCVAASIADRLVRLPLAPYSRGMADPRRPWTVLPHDAFQKLDERLWLVRGHIPGLKMPLRRIMTVIRRDDGGLVIHSAIALSEPSMSELERFGRPSLLIVPNGWHRLDAFAWKERYPALTVVCPAKAEKRVAQCVPVDGTLATFPSDGVVRAEPLDGLPAEGVLVVQCAAGTSLVFGDTFMNQPHMEGGEGFFYKLLGVSGGPRVHPFLKWMGKRKPLRAHLLRLAETPGLVRLIPGHGEVVDADASAVLRAAAERM